MSDDRGVNLLDEIDRSSPYGADGRLIAGFRDRLGGLPDAEPGRAVSMLVRHAARIRGDSGVAAAQETAAFGKIPEQLILDEHLGVPHSGHFANLAVALRLVAWLGAGLPAAPGPAG
jgi:hypothetical protein